MPYDANIGELRALSNLIQISIDELEAGLISKSQVFPSADEPFSLESEAGRMLPESQAAVTNIVAAAAQLIAAAQSPVLRLLTTTVQFHLATAIRVVAQSHVAEVLRDSGPQGLHVKDIAAPSGVDATKLARVLRLLATNHIFKEVSPNVFAHNRISTLLDTGKSIQEIVSDVSAKYDNTDGLVALVEHIADEGMKTSAFIPEALFHPTFDRPIFAWLELPENAQRLRKFGIGMRTANMLSGPGGNAGFDLSALRPGSIIVDVGGGIGSHTLTMTKANEHLNFVVQDRKEVISDAEKFWETQLPEAVRSGRVTLQAQDLFEPQVLAAPAVFLLRFVLHDWSDTYCDRILRHLRAAAGENTTLVIIENVIPYVCGDPQSVSNVPGAASLPAPPPLLPNYGAASTLRYTGDLMMLGFCNGQERTVTHFTELLAKAGWRLTHVRRGISSLTSEIIARPL